MKIFILEDEPSVREYLLTILPLLSPENQIIGLASSLKEAQTLLPNLKPDLLLFDVELPDGQSFELLKMKNLPPAHVIFITAHNAFALQAIKFSALDYLLKPIDEDELEQALQKAQERLRADALHSQLELLEENLQRTRPKRLVLKDATQIHLVQTQDILRLEASGSYTHFFLRNGDQLVMTQTLKSYSTMLEGAGFFRVHHSHLVNLDAIQRIDKSEGLILCLEDGSEVPISVRRKDSLLKALGGR